MPTKEHQRPTRGSLPTIAPPMSSMPTNGLDSNSSGEVNNAQRAFGFMRRNIGLILVCVLLVPGAALGFALLQSKKYEASASLLFRDPGLDQKLFGSTFFEPVDDPARIAATNVRLVELDAVAARTSRALGLPGLSPQAVADATEVSPQGESDLIEVTAVNGDPATAARLANSFARQYIAFRKEADRAKVREAQALVQNKLNTLTPADRLGVEGVELETSGRQLEILSSLQTGNAELVQTARPPTSPSSPRPLWSLALGLLLGLVLAAGLALLREQLDRRLRDPADVRNILEAPVLAAIPEMRSMQGFPVSESQAGGVATEAFLMLRTNLRYFNIDDEVKSILVTSAAPKEGKTTVSVNLARAEASAGKRVLLIEADLRRPTIADQLGIAGTTGVTLVLTGVLSASEAIVGKFGMDVITAGPLPPNPAELIESQRMVDLVRWGEEHYDCVIIDTPPTAVVADAIPLVSVVSGVMVVVRLGQSRRDAVQRLGNQLVNTNAPLLGVVLNGSRRPRDDSYYSRPSQAFGNAPGPDPADGVADTPAPAANPRWRPASAKRRSARAADRTRARKTG